jgi:hypothetical protein
MGGFSSFADENSLHVGVSIGRCPLCVKDTAGPLMLWVLTFRRFEAVVAG